MGYDTDVCSLSRGQNFCRVEEESRRLDPRILGAGASVGVLKRPLLARRNVRMETQHSARLVERSGSS
jgi:hypothetical protein